MLLAAELSPKNIEHTVFGLLLHADLQSFKFVDDKDHFLSLVYWLGDNWDLGDFGANSGIWCFGLSGYVI